MATIVDEQLKQAADIRKEAAASDPSFQDIKDRVSKRRSRAETDIAQGKESAETQRLASSISESPTVGTIAGTDVARFINQDKSINSDTIKREEFESVINSPAFKGMSNSEKINAYLSSSMDIYSDPNNTSFSNPKLDEIKRVDIENNLLSTNAEKYSGIKDPELQRRVFEADVAERMKDIAALNTAKGAGQLDEKFEKLKGTLSYLQKGLTDGTFLDSELVPAGLSVQQTLALSRGRDAFMQQFIEDARTNYGNDEKFFNNLQNIEALASKTWSQKLDAVATLEKDIKDREWKMYEESRRQYESDRDYELRVLSETNKKSGTSLYGQNIYSNIEAQGSAPTALTPTLMDDYAGTDGFQIKALEGSYLSSVGTGMLSIGSTWTNGIDVDGQLRDPITVPRALDGGKIVSIKKGQTGFGNNVTIEKDGVFFQFSHLNDEGLYALQGKLNSGQTVKSGELLALIGNTGNAKPLGEGKGDGSHVDISAYTNKNGENKFLSAYEVEKMLNTGDLTNRSGTMTQSMQASARAFAQSMGTKFSEAELVNLNAVYSPDEVSLMNKWIADNRLVRVDDSQVGTIENRIVSSIPKKMIDQSTIAATSLLAYEQKLKELGGSEFLGTAELEALYKTAVLDLKEFFNLGVLNGQDQVIIEQVLTDPTTISQNLRGLTPFGETTVQSVQNVKNLMKSRIDVAYNNLFTIYGKYDPSQIQAMEAVDTQVNAFNNVVQATSIYSKDKTYSTDKKVEQEVSMGQSEDQTKSGLTSQQMKDITIQNTPPGSLAILRDGRYGYVPEKDYNPATDILLK